MTGNGKPVFTISSICLTPYVLIPMLLNVPSF
jgi:hypothetical protein